VTAQVHRSQIDTEEVVELGEANQSPTILAPDMAGNGQSHGGRVVERSIARVSRAVEGEHE
jgi:hypothetical protein